MENDNLVIKLCVEGTQAEFAGHMDVARKCYLQAWDSAQDDYEACIAAHYVARCQENPEDVFRWNQEALARADAVGDDRIAVFYPSLYVNLGHSYEMLGNMGEAQKYYDRAAASGLPHSLTAT